MRRLGGVALALGVLGIGLTALGPLLPAMADHVWGSDYAWTHRDFLGGWWLWWASGQGGAARWLALQSWPEGALPLVFHIPNPWDGWLLGPLGLTMPLGWNLASLGHHLGNLLAAALLLRAQGLRLGTTFIITALLATCPVSLSEISGGRTLSGVAWPGLLALVALHRPGGRAGVAAGLLLGLQGLCYLYTGLLFGLAALILRPRAGLLAAALPLLPYAIWLSPLRGAFPSEAPPAGFTRLPLAGALGLDLVPERLRLQPALLLGLLTPLALRGQRRWLAVTLLAGTIALGPTVGWTREQPLFVSPFAWALHLVPGLSRMHHPLRAIFLLVPALGLLLGRGLDRLPLPLRALPLGAALAFLPATRLATSVGASGEPTGAEAARWVADHGGTAVVDLSGEGGAALGLQTVHGLPMLEGLRPRREDDVGGRLRRRCDAWLRGERDPSLPADLRAAGFSHVLAIERDGRQIPDTLEQDLGPPVAPGVYALPPAPGAEPRGGAEQEGGG